MEENLTLKQKDRIAKRIYQKYRDAQLNLLYVNQHYNLFPQVDLFRIKEAPSKPDASFLALIQKNKNWNNIFLSLMIFIPIFLKIHFSLLKMNISIFMIPSGGYVIFQEQVIIV